MVHVKIVCFLQKFISIMNKKQFNEYQLFSIQMSFYTINRIMFPNPRIYREFQTLSFWKKFPFEIQLYRTHIFFSFAYSTLPSIFILYLIQWPSLERRRSWNDRRVYIMVELPKSECWRLYTFLYSSESKE